jgi:hypothetical protein
MSVADCRNGAESDPLQYCMEMWAFVDPENVHEQANVVVLCNDGRRYLCCLVIRNASVLFLDRLSF